MQGLFSSCGKRGPLFIAVRGPLTIAGSLVGSIGSRRAGSVVVAHGPSCSAACGIFPDQGLNPCPLHWQADSQPLHHQGSPSYLYFKVCIKYLLCIRSVSVIDNSGLKELTFYKGGKYMTRSLQYYTRGLPWWCSG